MTRVLIITHAYDVHADAVAWALEQKGHQVAFCNFGAFPTRRKSSIRINTAGSLVLNFQDKSLSSDGFAEYDVVWLRRIAPPFPSEQLPDGDRKVAMRECRSFQNAYLAMLAPDALWVNPLSCASAAGSKPMQLRKAVQAGLRIPDTLVSNDPGEVRAFASRHRSGIIYKPFHPATWAAESLRYVAATSHMTPDLLENDFAIQAAPGIYQPYVRKQHEIRLTVMGGTYMAARLSAHDGQILPVDIRPAVTTTVVTEIELTDSTKAACCRLMKSLGLVFGCIDLVETSEGELIFLEVNEMGQFLWVENLNPNIPMLDVFSQFLASADADFERSRMSSDRNLSMKAYEGTERYRRLVASDDGAAAGRLYDFGVPEPVF